MKPEESIRLLKAAQLMLLREDNQPISDLYYALQAGIDAIEEDWRPIKMRPGTDEEYEEFCRYGDCPREDFRIIECPVPDDGQEVLITTRWGDVCIDTWHKEIDCSWFEDHEDLDDVIAWMPKPKEYQPEVQDASSQS